jgi:hypothetical protein
MASAPPTPSPPPDAGCEAWREDAQDTAPDIASFCSVAKRCGAAACAATEPLATDPVTGDMIASVRVELPYGWARYDDGRWRESRYSRIVVGHPGAFRIAPCRFAEADVGIAADAQSGEETRAAKFLSQGELRVAALRWVRHARSTWITTVGETPGGFEIEAYRERGVYEEHLTIVSADGSCRDELVAREVYRERPTTKLYDPRPPPSWWRRSVQIRRGRDGTIVVQ